MENQLLCVLKCIFLNWKKFSFVYYQNNNIFSVALNEDMYAACGNKKVADPTCFDLGQSVYIVLLTRSTSWKNSRLIQEWNDSKDYIY